MAEIQTDYLEQNKPETITDLCSFLKNQAKLNMLDQPGDELIAIDSRGSYYTQAGPQGTLTRMEYFVDPSEEHLIPSVTEVLQKDLNISFRHLRSRSQ